MKHLEHIEKSFFRPGEYIVYDPTLGGKAVPIYRENGQFRAWINLHVYTGTLTQLNEVANNLIKGSK